jgi:hypothetical protein
VSTRAGRDSWRDARVDIVYVVRPGDDNEELRYSLRTVCAHLPHDRVWIAGHRPPWLVNVGHIPTEQTGTKWANSTTNLRAACTHPEVSQRFTLVNDDMFLLADQPDGVPVYNRGLLDAVIAEHHDRRWSRYVQGMTATRTRLAAHGYTDLLSFELHVPMPVDKTLMLRAMALGSRIPVWHKRTAYGAVAGLTGEQIADVKIPTRRGLPRAGAQFVSSNDQSFARGEVGRLIRARYPNPSRYETGH